MTRRRGLVVLERYSAKPGKKLSLILANGLTHSSSTDDCLKRESSSASMESVDGSRGENGGERLGMRIAEGLRSG